VSPVLLGETRPRAVKSHLCAACLGTIGTGDRYIRQRVVDGPEAWVWKAHLLCEQADWFIRRQLGLFDDDRTDPDEIIALLVRWFVPFGTPTESDDK